MRKRFCLTVFVLLSLTAASFAAGAAFFMRDGVSAAEVAMGSAATAGTEGVNAIYWNPAGLAEMGTYGWQLSSMYQMADHDRYYGWLAAAIRTEDYGNIGLSLMAYGVSDIDLYDESGVFMERAADAEYAAGITYSNRVNYQFRYGITARGHYQDLAGFRAVGYSVDAGVVFRPVIDRDIYAGVMIQNILGTLYWTGYGESMLTSYKAGISGSFFEDVVKTSFDAVVEDGYSRVLFRGGAEFKVFDVLFIRGGIDDMSPAAGAGLHYQAYKFDYAFVYDRGGLGDCHLFSLALMW
ncbi:MAG TPA: hypothetical protein ENN43_07480 [bacterium]|nr:hypothetical protein [bacterium]